MKEHKILVVDDDPISANIAAELLRTAGNKVDVFTNPQDILSIDLSPYDLFLLDIFMPNIDGLELLEFIRKNKDYDLKPVIFVTSLDDPNHLVMSLKQGADDYIRKPYDGRELIARIEKALHITRVKKTEQVITSVNEAVTKAEKQDSSQLTSREQRVFLLVNEICIALQHIKTISGEWEDLDYEIASDLKLIEKCVDTIKKLFNS